MADDPVVSKYSHDVAEVLTKAFDSLNDLGPSEVQAFLKDHAKSEIANYEKAFTDGDRGAVLSCIKVCMYTEVGVPQWAAQAFIYAVSAGEHGEITSWNDVFGRPKTKAAIAREERDLAYAHEVLRAINCADQPKDDKLFRMVGRQLGVGGATKVKELYAQARTHIPLDELRRAFKGPRVRSSKTAPPKSQK